MSLPSGWKITGLDECYWFQEGPGVRKWQFTDSGIKLLNVANIEKTGRLNLTKTERHIAVDEVEKRYKHFLMDAGDLVIASSGISFDEDGLLRTRGAFVEPQHLPLCLNTSTIRFKAKAEISSLDYLKHWLESREFRQQITKLVTGSAQQNFGPSHLKALRISLPPLPEQRRIAAILDQADALRAKRREALAELDQLTQSIFIEMFGDPLENSKNLSLINLGDATVFENGDRSSNYPSGDDIKESGVLFLSTKNITNHRLDLSTRSFITAEKFASLSRGKARKDDLLITLRGTLGSCCIYDVPDETAFINAQMMIIRPKLPLRPKYLHALLTSQRFQDLLSRIGQGAAVPQLTATQLGHLPIPIPAIDDQVTFEARIQSADKLKEKVTSQLVGMNNLFSSLQHRAFRGEL